jgi:hypothetical protein
LVFIPNRRYFAGEDRISSQSEIQVMSHTLCSLVRTTPKTRAEIRAPRKIDLTQRE